MEPQTGQQPVTTSIPPANFYGVSKKHHSTGKVVAIVLLVLIIMGCVAFGVYYLQQQKIDDANNKNQQLTSQVQNLQKQVSSLQHQTVTLSMTPQNAKAALQLTVPSGWANGADASIVQKTIDGTLYRVTSQVPTSDYLKLPTYQASNVFGAVKDAKGTKLYLLQVNGTLVASTCAPVKGAGCSPMFSGGPLFMVLSPFKQGDQALQPLNFALPSATQAVVDFQTILASLTL